MLDLSTSEKADSLAEAPDVDLRLREAWQRQRRFVSTRGLGFLAVSACAVLAVAFILDWRLELSTRGREVLLGASLVALLAVGYAAWWRRRRAFDAARIAIQVESLYPQLHSVLVSHVQLHERLSHPEDGSPALIRALSRNASEQARAVDFGRIIDFRRLRWLAAWCLVGLLILGAWSAWRPELVETFVQRMIHPAADIAYPTRTLLEPLTGDCDVKDGDGLELKVRATGQLPGDGTLVIYPEGGSPQKLAVSGSEVKDTPEARDFGHAFEAVHGDFTYVFRVGDAATRPATVHVFAEPTVHPRLEIHFPDYTHLPVQAVDTFTADVLEGSTVRWRLAVDRPVKSAEIRIDGEKQPLKLEVSADGLEVHGSRLPNRTFAYRLAWTDRGHGRDGQGGFDYQPPTRYTIKVHPDLPPRVLLSVPKADTVGTMMKKMKVVFNAKDDYGLKKARIVYGVEKQEGGDSGESSIEIPLPKGEPLEAEQQYVWVLRKSIPDLAEGDTVRYAVEVEDNRPKSPGVTRSDVRRIRIVSLADYAKMRDDERDRLLGGLKQKYDEEKQSVKRVEKLQGD